MPHVGRSQFNLIEEISEVAAKVQVLWPPQCLIHLHTIKLNWLWLLQFFILFFLVLIVSCTPAAHSVSVVASSCPTASSANLFCTLIDLSFPSYMSPLKGQALAWKSFSCSMWSIQRAETLHTESPTDWKRRIKGWSDYVVGASVYPCMLLAYLNRTCLHLRQCHVVTLANKYFCNLWEVG